MFGLWDLMKMARWQYHVSPSTKLAHKSKTFLKENEMTLCAVCGKITGNPIWCTWCSEECVDIAKGNTPRKPEGFVFGQESPDKIKDPGSSYKSNNEERRVYGDDD